MKLLGVKVWIIAQCCYVSIEVHRGSAVNNEDFRQSTQKTVREMLDQFVC